MHIYRCYSITGRQKEFIKNVGMVAEDAISSTIDIYESFSQHNTTQYLYSANLLIPSPRSATQRSDYTTSTHYKRPLTTVKHSLPSFSSCVPIKYLFFDPRPSHQSANNHSRTSIIHDVIHLALDEEIHQAASSHRNYPRNSRRTCQRSV